MTIGAVIVGAALVPAITANSGGTTTIRGDVTSGGQPVPFTEIGFWSPTDGVIANTLADSGGRFALDVPDAVDGYVFAGAAPDAYNAITSLGDREYVRGLIGAKKAPGVSTPLYQGWPAATAKSLAGGKGDLHLVLQRPGAIAGRSPVTGPALRSVQVRRLDGSVVQTLKVDKQGRYRSDPLVPGTYAVAVLPNGPLLPQAVQVTVPSGGTVTAPQPALVAGATIRGVLTADGAALTAPVPVQLLRNGVEVATTTSSAAGAYSFGPLQAGDYEVRIGRYPDSGRVKSPTAEPVPVVGRTVAPTASASPSPTPTPSAPAVDGGTVQLQPVVRTSDAYLPTSVNAVVPDALGLVQVDTDLMPAGRIAGKVEGGSGAPAQVLVEDAVSGQILRSAQVDAATGGYTAGGLTPGTEYRVYAV
ncbi:MAG: hypothetical protein QOE37_469, partial [Microbacteriaceae bacterium]|nr:hypothetical protein [Microbacteriaceae bacterium]